jgi:hypothetical protein
MFSLAIAASLAVFSWLGGWIASRRAEEDSRPSALLESTLFSIFGLLLAFTLSGAAGRLETRRMASIDEANALGTACLRVSLVDEPHRHNLERLYEAYITNRLDFNETLSGALVATQRPLRKLSEIQSDIWKESVAGAEGPNRLLVIDATNHLFDASATRETRTLVYTPAPLMGLLLALAALCAVFMGRDTARLSLLKAWVYRGVFAVVVAASLTVLADMDNPRIGMIRMGEVDALLKGTRDLLPDAGAPQPST